MQIAIINGATRTLAKDQPQYRQLSIVDDHDLDGQPIMTSGWLPDQREVERIRAGAPIFLQVLGTQHPPVCLYVGEKDDVEPSKSGGAEQEYKLPIVARNMADFVKTLSAAQHSIVEDFTHSIREAHDTVQTDRDRLQQQNEHLRGLVKRAFIEGYQIADGHHATAEYIELSQYPTSVVAKLVEEVGDTTVSNPQKVEGVEP